MDHGLEALLGKQRGHLLLIAQVEPDEAKGGVLLQLLQAGELQRHIVVVVEIIQADHLVAPGQETLRREKTNESGRAGDQKLHAGMIKEVPASSGHFLTGDDGAGFSEGAL